MKHKTIITMSLIIVLDVTALVAWRGRGKHVTGLEYRLGMIPISVVTDGGSGALAFRTPWGGRRTLYRSINDSKLYWGEENFIYSNRIPLNCDSELAKELLRTMRRHAVKHKYDTKYLQNWISYFDEQRKSANKNLDHIPEVQ